MRRREHLAEFADELFLAQFPGLVRIQLVEPRVRQSRKLVFRELLISILVGLRQHLRGNKHARAKTPTTRAARDSLLTLGLVQFRRLVCPDCPAVALVEGDQSGLLVRTEVEDAQLAIQDGRHCVTKHVVQPPEVAMPGFLAVEGVRVNARRSETDINSLTVRCGCAGTIGIHFLRRFIFRVAHARLPEQFAVRSVEAHQGATILLLDRLCDQDAIAPDDGRRVATVRKRDLPAHVLFRAPFDRETLF